MQLFTSHIFLPMVGDITDHLCAQTVGHKTSPFVVKLNPGWNLMGNPYNFTISWDDVILHNGSPVGLGELRQYLNGGFVSEPILNRYRGGYVFNSTNSVMDVAIPIVNRGPAGGRKANSSPKYAPDNWLAKLSLDDGNTSSDLYSIGMRSGAQENQDVFDEELLPMLLGMSSYTFSLKGKLAKDVVPPANEYTWVAQVENENPVTMRWDNLYLADSWQDIMLDDNEEVLPIDMKKQKEYRLRPGKHTVRFVYGNTAYIKNQLKRNAVEVGSPWPNPITTAVAELNIPISLPEGSWQIVIRAYNQQGTVIDQHEIRNHVSGRQTLVFENFGNQLSRGQYMLEFIVSGPNGSTTITKRLIVD